MLTSKEGYIGVRIGAGWDVSNKRPSDTQEAGERLVKRAFCSKPTMSSALGCSEVPGAGSRCRICVLRPRFTGRPHSQLRRRDEHLAQTGFSSPHLTLRRRQVLQPSKQWVSRPCGKIKEISYHSWNVVHYVQNPAWTWTSGDQPVGMSEKIEESELKELIMNCVGTMDDLSAEADKITRGKLSHHDVTSFRMRCRIRKWRCIFGMSTLSFQLGWKWTSLEN